MTLCVYVRIAQLVRAVVLLTTGQGFEPLYEHLKIIMTLLI